VAVVGALFGWLIQPDSASRSSIFLSREISQPSSQQYFPLTQNQPASQPASQPNKAYIYILCSYAPAYTRRTESWKYQEDKGHYA